MYEEEILNSIFKDAKVRIHRHDFVDAFKPEAEGINALMELNDSNKKEKCDWLFMPSKLRSIFKRRFNYDNGGSFNEDEEED